MILCLISYLRRTVVQCHPRQSLYYFFSKPYSNSLVGERPHDRICDELHDRLGREHDPHLHVLLHQLLVLLPLPRSLPPYLGPGPRGGATVAVVHGPGGGPPCVVVLGRVLHVGEGRGAVVRGHRGRGGGEGDKLPAVVVVLVTDGVQELGDDGD